MKLINFLCYVFHRFRYPVSLPEEIAIDLGITTSNFLTFKEFVNQLTNRTCRLQRLSRFMPREEAEAVFQSALRKEKFKGDSLFSYYFHEGWLEFILQFDEHSRLRRIYLQHKHIKSERGIELMLRSDSSSK